MVKIKNEICHKEGSGVLKIGLIKMLKVMNWLNKVQEKLQENLITV